jgi:hypothetical protein
LPHDPDGLRMASRGKELRDRMTCVDLTRLYVAHPGTAVAGSALP